MVDNPEAWRDAKEVFVKIGRATDRAGLDVLRDFGTEATNEMRRLVSRGGRGRLYRKTRPTRTHRASAPGDPPATDTGRLVGAIGYRETGGAGDTKTIEVGASVPYGLFLETGTSKMSARPFIRPAVATAAERMRSKAADKISQAQRRSS